MTHRIHKAHMLAAYVYANLSYCKRRQVGCVIVQDGTPIAIGYNGTPAKTNNCCEDEEGHTKPNVIHAEDNALRKLIRSPHSSVGSTVYVTTAPCKNCAQKLVDAKVVKVFYSEIYHNIEGIAWLESHGIQTEQIKI